MTLLLALSATGCGSDSMMGPKLNHSATTQQMGLTLTTATAKATYAFGSTITIQATVRNSGSSPVTLTFERGTPPRYSNFNLSVDDSVSTQVYAQGDGTQDSLTLQPGQSKDYTFVWDEMDFHTHKPVPAGDYELKVFSGLKDGSSLQFKSLFVRLQ